MDMEVDNESTNNSVESPLSPIIPMPQGNFEGRVSIGGSAARMNDGAQVNSCNKADEISSSQLIKPVVTREIGVVYNQATCSFDYDKFDELSQLDAYLENSQTLKASENIENLPVSKKLIPQVASSSYCQGSWQQRSQAKRLSLPTIAMRLSQAQSHMHFESKLANVSGVPRQSQHQPNGDKLVGIKIQKPPTLKNNQDDRIMALLQRMVQGGGGFPLTLFSLNSCLQELEMKILLRHLEISIPAKLPKMQCAMMLLSAFNAGSFDSFLSKINTTKRDLKPVLEEDHTTSDVPNEHQGDKVVNCPTICEASPMHQQQCADIHAAPHHQLCDDELGATESPSAINGNCAIPLQQTNDPLSLHLPSNSSTVGVSNSVWNPVDSSLTNALNSIELGKSRDVVLPIFDSSKEPSVYFSDIVFSRYSSSWCRTSLDTCDALNSCLNPNYWMAIQRRCSTRFSKGHKQILVTNLLSADSADISPTPQCCTKSPNTGDGEFKSFVGNLQLKGPAIGNQARVPTIEQSTQTEMSLESFRHQQNFALSTSPASMRTVAAVSYVPTVTSNGANITIKFVRFDLPELGIFLSNVGCLIKTLYKFKQFEIAYDVQEKRVNSFDVEYPRKARSNGHTRQRAGRATFVKQINGQLLPENLIGHIKVMDELVSVEDMWVSDIFADRVNGKLMLSFTQQTRMITSSTRPIWLGFI